MIPSLLLGAAEQAQQNEDYESWTEDDDSEFEYEPTDSYAHRHSTSCFCRFMMILVAVLAVYIMLFVRVNPTSIRGVNELEVEFGFNNLVPSMNLPIPDQLHQFTSALIGQASRPGMTARMDGLRAHFPIVFVPGIVSTGLEVWQGEKCARDHFRQRLWGSTLMIRTMLLDSRSASETYVQQHHGYGRTCSVDLLSHFIANICLLFSYLVDVGFVIFLSTVGVALILTVSNFVLRLV